MRARQRVIDDEGRLVLREMLDSLGLKAGSPVAVVPIGKGVYVAPIGKVGQRRRGGQPTTKELLHQAMRALTAAST